MISLNIDYVFVEQLILVIIPLTVAAATSKWVTNAWQERNERSKLRDGITAKSSASIGEMLMVCVELGMRINHAYLKFVRETQEDDIKLFDLPELAPETSMSTAQGYAILNKSLVESHPPALRFKDDMDKFVSNYFRAGRDVDKFRNILSIYFKDSPLEQEVDKIVLNLSTLFLVTTQFASSDSVDSFVQNNRAFFRTYNVLEAQVSKFDANLLKANINL